jgi:hypothetical protein
MIKIKIDEYEKYPVYSFERDGRRKTSIPADIAAFVERTDDLFWLCQEYLQSVEYEEKEKQSKLEECIRNVILEEHIRIKGL